MQLQAEIAELKSENIEHIPVKSKKKKKRKLEDPISDEGVPEKSYTSQPEQAEETPEQIEETAVKSKKKKKKRKLEDPISDEGIPEESCTSQPELAEETPEQIEDISVKSKKKKKRKLEDPITDEGAPEKSCTSQPELAEETPEQMDKASAKLKSKTKKKKKSLDSVPDEVLSEMYSTSLTDQAEESPAQEKLIESESQAEEKGAKEKEVTGFTSLPDVSKDKTTQVKRHLPDWLAKPSVFDAHLSNRQPIESFQDLAPFMLENLRQQGITNLLPVQMKVVPLVLSSVAPGTILTRDGLPPRDICCSAPTGSGKTLAFTIPIVQILSSTIRKHIRALIIVPSAELADQVGKVFSACCTSTHLKVGIASGQVSRIQELPRLVSQNMDGPNTSNVDILIATPTRLADHLSHSEGFDLSHVRFLVVDEADRMLSDKMDWLHHVESVIYSKRGYPQPLTIHHAKTSGMPLQKLLFSATLSDDAETLQQLRLQQPHHITPGSYVPGSVITAEGEAGEDEPIPLMYTTPEGLQEYLLQCETPQEKPLVILHMLFVQKLQHVLIFCNSYERVRRLCLFINQFKGDKKVNVSSISNQECTKKERAKLVRKFTECDIDVLVTTDLLARGLDVPMIEHVILYDVPVTLKGYIHRVGRAARAGRPGKAYTLVLKTSCQDTKFSKSLSNRAGKTVITEHIETEELDALRDGCQNALKGLETALLN